MKQDSDVTGIYLRNDVFLSFSITYFKILYGLNVLF